MNHPDEFPFSHFAGMTKGVDGNGITRLKIFDLTEGRGDAALLDFGRDVY
jgi:hypothetical protein